MINSLKAIIYLLIFSTTWPVGWVSAQTHELGLISGTSLYAIQPGLSSPSRAEIQPGTPVPGDGTTTPTTSPYPYPFRTPSPNFPIVLGAAAIALIILAAWWMTGRLSPMKE